MAAGPSPSIGGILPHQSSEEEQRRMKQRKQQQYADALAQQMQAKSSVAPAAPSIAPSRDAGHDSDREMMNTEAEIERLRGLRLALEAQNSAREQRIRQMSADLRSGPSISSPPAPAAAQTKAAREPDKDKDAVAGLGFDPREMARANAAAMGILPSARAASSAEQPSSQSLVSRVPPASVSPAMSSLPEWYRRKFGGQPAADSRDQQQTLPQSVSASSAEAVTTAPAPAAVAWPPAAAGVAGFDFAPSPEAYAQYVNAAQATAAAPQPYFYPFVPMPAQYSQYGPYSQYAQYYTLAQHPGAPGGAALVPSATAMAQERDAERDRGIDRDRGRDWEAERARARDESERTSARDPYSRSAERPSRLSLSPSSQSRDRERDSGKSKEALQQTTPLNRQTSKASIAAMGSAQEEAKQRAKQEKRAYGQELLAAIAEKEAAKKREREAAKAAVADDDGFGSGSRRRDKNKDRERERESEREPARHADRGERDSVRDRDRDRGRDRESDRERDREREYVSPVARGGAMNGYDYDAAQRRPMPSDARSPPSDRAPAFGATLVAAHGRSAPTSPPPAAARAALTRERRDRDRDRDAGPPPRTPPQPGLGARPDAQRPTSASRLGSGGAGGDRQRLGSPAQGDGSGQKLSSRISPSVLANKRQNEESSIFGPPTLQTKITTREKQSNEAKAALQAEMRRMAEEALKKKELEKQKAKEEERKLDEKIARELEEQRKRDLAERERMAAGGGRRSMGRQGNAEEQIPRQGQPQAGQAGVSVETVSEPVRVPGVALAAAAHASAAQPSARGQPKDIDDRDTDALRDSGKRRLPARGRASLADDRVLDAGPPFPAAPPQTHAPPVAANVVNVDDLPAGAKARKVAVQQQQRARTPAKPQQTPPAETQPQLQRPVSSHSQSSNPKPRSPPTQAPTQAQATGTRPDTPSTFEVVHARPTDSHDEDDLEFEEEQLEEEREDADTETQAQQAQREAEAERERQRQMREREKERGYGDHLPLPSLPRRSSQTSARARGDQLFDLDAEDEIPSVSSPMVKNDRALDQSVFRGSSRAREHAERGEDRDTDRGQDPESRESEIRALHDEIFRRNQALKQQLDRNQPVPARMYSRTPSSQTRQTGPQSDQDISPAAAYGGFSFGIGSRVPTPAQHAHALSQAHARPPATAASALGQSTMAESLLLDEPQDECSHADVLQLDSDLDGAGAGPRAHTPMLRAHSTFIPVEDDAVSPRTAMALAKLNADKALSPSKRQQQLQQQQQRPETAAVPGITRSPSKARVAADQLTSPKTAASRLSPSRPSPSPPVVSSPAMHSIPRSISAPAHAQSAQALLLASAEAGLRSPAQRRVGTPSASPLPANRPRTPSTAHIAAAKSPVNATAEDAVYQDDFDEADAAEIEDETLTAAAKPSTPLPASRAASAAAARVRTPAPTTATAIGTAGPAARTPQATAPGSGRPPRPVSSRPSFEGSVEDPETAALIAQSEQYTARLKAEIGAQRWQDMQRLYSPDMARAAAGRSTARAEDEDAVQIGHASGDFGASAVDP